MKRHPITEEPLSPSPVLTRQVEMSTAVAKQFFEWRDVLRDRVKRSKLPFYDGAERLPQDKLVKWEREAINRQVALAIISDLEYNHRLPKHDIKTLTGKSQVYWNFQILGTTQKRKDDRSYRKEQVTTDYFVATLLNSLEHAGVQVDWKRLGFYLEQTRWRVIAEPADKGRRSEWREIVEDFVYEQERGRPDAWGGLDYAAPWHVANFSGKRNVEEEYRTIEFDNEGHALDPYEMLFLGGKSFEDMSWEEVADTIDAPGRVRRVDIRSFPPSGYIASKDGHHDQMTIKPQIHGEEGYEPRPRILQGLNAGG